MSVRRQEAETRETRLKQGPERARPHSKERKAYTAWRPVHRQGRSVEQRLKNHRTRGDRHTSRIQMLEGGGGEEQLGASGAAARWNMH